MGRARWIFVFAPALLLAIVSVWAHIGDHWDSLGVQGMGSQYADLQLVTSTADCVDADPDWNMDSPTCDPFGRAWNYPTVWARSFAALGLGSDRTNEVGVVLGIGFCIACAVLSWLVSRPELRVTSGLAGALAILAPAGWLALERGNVDLLIFIVLTVAIALCARGHDVAAIPFLAFATAWKIYPFGAAVGVVRGLRRWLAYVVVFLVSGGILLPWEIAGIVARTQRSTGSSFGMTVVPERVLAHLAIRSDAAVALVGAAVLAAGIVAVLGLERYLGRRGHEGLRGAVSLLVADRPARSMLLVAGGSFLFAYVAGSSWDYRLILLIPCVLAMAATAKPATSVVMWGLVAVMYLSRWNEAAEYLADLMLLGLVPALIVLWWGTARLPVWRRARAARSVSDPRTSAGASRRRP